MQNALKNIDEYNTSKRRKMIRFDDMIADMISSESLNY